MTSLKYAFVLSIIDNLRRLHDCVRYLYFVHIQFHVVGVKACSCPKPSWFSNLFQGLNMGNEDQKNDLEDKLQWCVCIHFSRMRCWFHWLARVRGKQWDAMEHLKKIGWRKWDQTTIYAKYNFIYNLIFLKRWYL
jgi:hypothetical protein